jgi:hypothetical protein
VGNSFAAAGCGPKHRVRPLFDARDVLRRAALHKGRSAFCRAGLFEQSMNFFVAQPPRFFVKAVSSSPPHRQERGRHRNKSLFGSFSSEKEQKNLLFLKKKKQKDF